MNSKNRRSRSRNRRHRRQRLQTLSRTVFATVSAGNTVDCTSNQLHVPEGRSFKLIAIRGSVVMLSGNAGIFEAVLYNQGATQISTSGPMLISIGSRLSFNVSSPRQSDMWFDAGRSQSSTTKISHFDFPCISKTMSQNVYLLNARIYYSLGRELVTDICPTLQITTSRNNVVHDESNDFDIV